MQDNTEPKPDRRKKDPSEQLSKFAFFRVTESEKARLEAHAAETGQTLSALLRTTVQTSLNL